MDNTTFLFEFLRNRRFNLVKRIYTVNSLVLLWRDGVIAATDRFVEVVKVLVLIFRHFV